MAKTNGKVAGTKAIVKKEEPGKLASWEQEALAEASKDTAKFAAGVPRISFQGGKVSIDKKVIGSTITVAVIETVFGKAFYPGAFNPKVQQTPTCYAFNPDSTKGMLPHVAAPDRQCEKCDGCEHNAFGTAITGNGKRCKDELRLMVIAPGEDYATAEVRMASVPPGSLKHWAKYVGSLKDMNASFRTVFTEIEVEPEGTAYKLNFRAAGKMDEAAYRALKERRATAIEQAMQPYPVIETDPKDAAKAAAASKKRNAKVA